MAFFADDDEYGRDGRGWAMRHGRRRACAARRGAGGGEEGCGRARFARSCGKYFGRGRWYMHKDRRKSDRIREARSWAREECRLPCHIEWQSWFGDGAAIVPYVDENDACDERFASKCLVALTAIAVCDVYCQDAYDECLSSETCSTAAWQNGQNDSPSVAWLPQINFATRGSAIVPARQLSFPCPAIEKARALARAESALVLLHAWATLSSGRHPQRSPGRPSASRWDEAQVRAAQGAMAWQVLQCQRSADVEKRKLCKVGRERAVPGDPSQTEHADVLAMTARKPGSFPDCWMLSKTGTLPVAASLEYRAVTGYFLKTLASQAEVLGLSRVQNPTVWQRFQDNVKDFKNQTIMFHGCRCQANEDSICNNGFQVSCCRSGGAGYGTWFAHRAAYSNGGYVFVNDKGVRHIFVCLVSDVPEDRVLDNPTMRVVRQDCAYPLWLLTYKILPPKPVSEPMLQPQVVSAAHVVKSKVPVKKEDDVDVKQPPEGQTVWKFKSSRGRVKAWTLRRQSEKLCWVRMRHVRARTQKC